MEVQGVTWAVKLEGSGMVRPESATTNGEEHLLESSSALAAGRRICLLYSYTFQRYARFGGRDGREGVDDRVRHCTHVRQVDFML